MSKIKSERAKAKIKSEGWNPYNRYGDISDEMVYHEEDVEIIVQLAEQDAEDRAVKAYCKSECDWDGHCHKRKECYMLSVFVDNLNNGGQSDE